MPVGAIRRPYVVLVLRQNGYCHQQAGEEYPDGYDLTIHEILPRGVGTSLHVKGVAAGPREQVFLSVRPTGMFLGASRSLTLDPAGLLVQALAMNESQPLVGVVMGSKSDWETMRRASETLETLGIAHEVRVISGHRTPDLCIEYATVAEERGLEVIITGAGGAAHLGGMMAAKTLVPVLGVPMKAWALDGLDSLLSIVQMPAGIPVGTLAIGNAGATNAALLAAEILGNKYPEVREAVRKYRAARTQQVLDEGDPRESD
jgi:5-(carboxyamino)imidazole ribonucleotide mutase